MKSISSKVVVPVALILGSSNAFALSSMTATDIDDGRRVDNVRPHQSKVEDLSQSPLITELTLTSKFDDSQTGANVDSSAFHEARKARIRQKLDIAAKRIAESEWFKAAHVDVEPPEFTRIEADTTT